MSSLAKWRRCKNIVSIIHMLVLTRLLFCREVAGPVRRANTSLGNNNKRIVITIVVLAFIDHVRLECVTDALSSSCSLFRLNEHAAARSVSLNICIVYQYTVFAIRRDEVSTLQGFDIAIQCPCVYVIHTDCIRICRCYT